MKHLSNKLLYIVWAALFLLTAVLGFVFPVTEGGGLLAPLTAVVFFVPPFLLLHRGGRFQVLLIRWLSLASITLTAALLVLNLMSANWSESLGNALHAALVIVSAPMVCGGHYALSLFLWGTLLAGTFGKK